MHKAAFTPENAALLLIDYRLGTMGWTHSHDINLVEANALKLAKIVQALDLPVVSTASMEDQMRRSFRKSSHYASCLKVLEQPHCRCSFRDTDSQFARPPPRNAER